MSLIKLIENSNLDKLYSKLQCHVVSNAFSMFKNTAAVDILLLKLRITWSMSLTHISVVLWRARKTNWLALSILLSLMCFWTIIRITFSNNLLVVERRLIFRKFWGNFGCLPGFGNVMIFASFQYFVKWDSRRQWLNKCVKYVYTNGRLWRCVWHSFGMPTIPQDFLNLKELISFCKTHGLVLSRGLVVYGFKQSLNSSLRPPFMVFITQIMVWTEFPSSRQFRCISRTNEIWGLKDHE
jgi:hypothetical protein